YEQFNISDDSNFRRLKSTDYPILSEFYDFLEKQFQGYDNGEYQLYNKDILQDILLGLHSMCKGAESKFFNGHTNVVSDRFIVFGVKGLLQASKNVKNAMLFNVLSYMSDKLLTEGNTVATVDELYLFLTNMIAIEYLRNFMKRVRKKESAVILASQNIEDFAIKEIAEFTKPLFSIPTHQFLFNAGTIDKKFYMDTLQLEDSEFNLIKFPQRGTCLFKSGNDRYNLMVQAPEYKAKLFGTAGGN
ncbi:MAG: type IV secretory system conjugative DNA transfer family protein, partial [Clostridia bacterium]